MTYRRLLQSGGLAALLFFSFTLLHAQYQIRFHRITMQQGLSQSAVTCIFQDSQGFMWLGTQDGLNRYDGYSFNIYKNRVGDSASLSDNFILSIYEDEQNVLWFGTLNNPNILNRFDRLTEGFTYVPADSVDLSRARVSSVFTTYRDPKGFLWTGSRGGGLTRLNTTTGEKKTFKNDPKNPGSLSDDRVYSVYGDRSGTIWVGTRGGLDKFDPGTESFVHYRHDPKNPNSISDNWVWPILEDRYGNLWIGTGRGGLNHFNRKTGVFTRYLHDATDPLSISDNYIFSIYESRSGLIWVGTNGDGVNTFHPGLGGFVTYSHTPEKANSLSDNTVRALHVDRQGTVWIGTAEGLDRFDENQKTFTHFKRGSPAGRGPTDIPNALLEDRSGTLWVGTLSSGLDRFDQSTGRFINYKTDPSRPGSLSDNAIYALLEDRAGTLWVGTYNGGLNRLDRSSGKFTAYMPDTTNPAGISERGVWALCEDRDGYIWVGTYKGGLNRLDPKTGHFTVFKNDPANRQSISDNNITCILEDRNRTLWVGTTNGLNSFKRSDGTFKQYLEEDGLPNRVVLGIVEDGAGNIWISTNHGLSRFNPKTGQFRNFDANDGLQGHEFNQNAYARNSVTGMLYFGGGKGFNAFHPDSIRENPYVPPIVFSAMRRYNTDDAEGKPIDEPGMSVRQDLTLTYKDNIVTFEFAALSYYISSKNTYSYKLENFSDNWIQLGRERYATFTNLDPGEYVLRVRGANNDGVWNMDGSSIKFVVTPPWWKTRWAYAAYVLIFFGILYELRRFEINRREEKARVRESELRAKAAEAEKRVLQVENDRKTKELEEARQLQLSMLPREMPKLPHLEIAVFMRTATEVGGDYYDYNLQSDGTLSLAFGDATGHGMQAGTIVTLMKGLFTSDASRLDIQPFFNHCSKSIKEIKLGRLLMAFSLVKFNGTRISLSSAGMPPLYIHRGQNGALQEILLKGMPLGAMKSFPYQIHEDELSTGDTLLLVSDGLPEQKNVEGEMYDYDRLKLRFTEVAPTEHPQDIIQHLMKGIDEWMEGAVQDDDITLMVVKVTQSQTIPGELPVSN